MIIKIDRINSIFMNILIYDEGVEDIVRENIHWSSGEREDNDIIGNKNPD